MKQLFFFLMAIVSLLFMDSAFALSDADYMKFTQESPAFAQADARLNAAWKQLKSGLSKAEYQALLREQRVWLKKRDEIAQTVRSAKEGRSMAEAYASETARRADELEQRIVSSSTSSFIGEFKNEFGLLELSQTDNGLWAQYSATAPDVRWTCAFEGLVQVKGNILTVILNDYDNKILLIKAVGNHLEIAKALNPEVNMGSFCGFGGTIEGIYIKSTNIVAVPASLGIYEAHYEGKVLSLMLDPQGRGFFEGETSNRLQWEQNDSVINAKIFGEEGSEEFDSITIEVISPTELKRDGLVYQLKKQ